MEHGPLNWRDRGALWVRIGIRVALVVAAVLLLRYAAPPLLSLLGPFVLALIVAWLLNPLVRWLHRRLSISRNAISLVLIVLIFCAIGGALFGLGYRDLRVRLFHGAARLQLPPGQLEKAAGERGALLRALSPWFDTVLLDLRQR